jgi:hypothetical protein
MLLYWSSRDCIVYKKKFSYRLLCSDAMQELDEAAKQNNNFHEWIGLDPGIDHMSAMKWLMPSRRKVAKWFFWVVLWRISCSNRIRIFGIINLLGRRAMWCLPVKVALPVYTGRTYKYIPYCNLFHRTEFLQVEGYGRFEAYSNRIRSNTAACMV